MKSKTVGRFVILVSVCILLFPEAASPTRYYTRAAGPSDASPKRSSSAIAITADGATLLIVNPDSNSLSVVDLGTLVTTTEIPVGLDPRTVAVDDDGSRAYVANRGSDSISVVDLIVRQVITEVAVGDRPYGVVVSPDGTRLYVTEQGSDQLRFIETTSFATLAVLPTMDRPSGLALSHDGQTLYVTHLLNNVISVVDTRLYFVHLPLILRGEPVRSAHGRDCGCDPGQRDELDSSRQRSSDLGQDREGHKQA